MDYKRSRDIAWQILIENQIKELPVNIELICHRKNINLFKYEQSYHLLAGLSLSEHLLDNDAFSIGAMVFYDSEQSPERIRFSIAHEIGHIVLHASKCNQDKPTVYNREPSHGDAPLEKEANIFASRLLAPLCVLQFLNVNSAKEISEICGISYTAAKFRFSRLCEIRKRSSERMKSKNHGTFLLSEKERAVIENFKDFIQKNKR